MSSKKISPETIVRQLRKKLLKEYGRSPQDIHKFRILLKKVRYLLALFGKESATLKGYQDVFGYLNDLQNYPEYGGKNKSIESAYRHQLKLSQKELPRAKKLALVELNRLSRAVARRP
jgi:CHAD domain-containing protein